MNHYFTLTFSPPDGLNVESAAELLAAARVDALCGIGIPGRVALDFDVEGRSAAGAIVEAIIGALCALPGSALIGVTYDEATR